MVELSELFDSVRCQTVTPDAIRTALRAILGMHSTQATRHPLGFLMLKLWTADDRTLRLHVWPRERHPQDPILPIHDHSFSFTSIVLHGGLENCFYNERPANSTRFDVYNVRYTSNSSIIERTDQTIAVTPACRFFAGAGTRYEASSRIFHEADAPNDSAAATLVAARQEAGVVPRVLVPKGHSDNFEFTRTLVSETDFLAALRECSLEPA